MTDHANISLQVARIIHPDVEWEECFSRGAAISWKSYLNGDVFDYRTDAALGQMAKWLSHRLGDQKYETLEEAKLDHAVLPYLLRGDNPNLALATAIIELKENG